MDFHLAPATFISDILRIVDNLTANFIQSGFNAIAHNLATSGLLTSILTLYVLHLFYQMQHQQLPVTETISHLIKVCLVFLISTNWAVFYRLIFNVATNEPLHILQLLLAGKEGAGDGGLNDIFTNGLSQAFSLLKGMPFSLRGALCTILAVALLVIATFLFTMLALSLLVISKFYLAVMLALAPYFLLMMLFNGTKGLSESWVKTCLNHALVPVFVGSVLLLTSTLAKGCLNTSLSGVSAKAPDFAGVLTYLFTGLLSAFLFKTIPEKAASLTASLAIASAGRVSGYAKQLGSNVGGGLAKGVGAAKESFTKRQQALYQGIQERAQARAETMDAARARRARSGY